MYEILRYVDENIKEKISLEELANNFGYSQWHLSKKFKQTTGYSYTEYVNNRRMGMAVLDILNGEKVTEVALKYGYDTTSGFNKAFMTRFGCSPKMMKKETIKSYIEYQERRDTMYKITDRVEFLRNEAVNVKTMSEKVKHIWQFLFRLGELSCSDNDSNMIITAKSLCNVIKNSPGIILDNELIVGYNFGDNGHNEKFDINDNEKTRKNLMQCGFTKEQIDFYFANENVSKYKMMPYKEEYTPQESQLHQERAAMGRCMANNHTVIGYEEVLKHGFEGLLERVEAFEKINGESDLYTSLKMICNEAVKFGDKYSEEALKQAETASKERAAELKEIAKVCQNVPRKPAASFREAIQSLWFAHILNTWEDRINANSLGRLDQILYPYYKNDIENGVISKDEAFELVCCLWIKLYRDYDVQQSCVGGSDADGNEVVNDLSYMMLDATEKLDFIRCLSVRFSRNTDKKFLKRALEVVGHVQKGIPFFFNDDVMIPALEYGNIAHEDAVGYSQIGCVETVIPGKSNPHAVTGETNLLKALEYTLNEGKSMVNEGFTPGINTGAVKDFDTYEKLYSAIKKNIYHILDVCCRKVMIATDAHVVNAPKPYKSLLTEGCVESNRDFNAYGAKYDYYQIMLGGVPNLADSLEVIRKFVYEDRKYTLEEVVYQMQNDFPDEQIRLEFLNRAAKFGNDIDSVDFIARDIIDYSCSVLTELSDKYDLLFHAQPFTYLWMVDDGKVMAATPDGRHKGEIIAYSVSPMQGRDFNGLTALFNSLAKLPTKKTPGTTSAIVEVDPAAYSDRNIDSLVDILLTAGEKGLSNVQFNTVDKETLMEAQKHPENYNNLAVRVSGFSQKFNLLDKDLQDHIIGRTKHKCL